MNHTQFAERAARRLESAAAHLEDEGRRLEILGEASKISARAGEMRVAALLVRDEARAVSRTEEEPSTDPLRLLADDDAPPFEAQA